jgi:TolB protein
LLAALAVLWASRGSAGAKRIVFQAKVHGLYQLFTIKPDGTDLEQITQLVVRNSSIPGAEQATWSPDGKTIIFDSDYGRTKGHVINVFTIKPEGTGLTQLRLVGAFAGAPAYSPDGKMISFDWDANASSLHEQGIDIADADGRYARRLTVFHTANGLDQRSNWSPDGEWIAYTESRGPGQSAIIKIKPEGTGRDELTLWAMNANNAKWSPDGSRIVFNSHNDPQPGEDANLYTMRPDGTGLVQLTHYRGGRLNAYAGSWSPDGKQIVFHLRGADPDGPGVNQLFIIDADGSNMHQLTHLPHGMNPGYASWSPAG